MTHTPGPWAVGFEGLRGGTYWCVSRSDAAEEIDIHEDDNGEADARLIAAAPDLLAAAKELRATISKNEPMPFEAWNALCDEVIERADAAIAKAEGRALTSAQADGAAK